MSYLDMSTLKFTNHSIPKAGFNILALAVSPQAQGQGSSMGREFTTGGLEQEAKDVVMGLSA